jgi:hypothetical protein
MITAPVYGKLPVIRSHIRKAQWIEKSPISTVLYGWDAIYWVVLDDHYHVIAKAPDQTARNLPAFVASYHKFTAQKWNQADQTRGRRVWWNYWDTCIGSEDDFRIRLNYIQGPTSGDVGIRRLPVAEEMIYVKPD